MSQFAATQECSQSTPVEHVSTPDLVNVWGQLTPITKHTSMHCCVGEQVSIGRKTSNTITIAHPTVSGDHCVLSRDNAVPPVVWVEDKSRNSTFVNGIKPSSLISISSTAQCRFECAPDDLAPKVGRGNRWPVTDGDVLSLAHPLRKGVRPQGFVVGYVFHDVSRAQPGYAELCQKYLLCSDLGTGTFATVKAAVEIGSGERVAIKVIDKSKHWSDERTREQLLREINILRNIRHPNITAIKDVVESDLYLFLVLELCTGGDLFETISKHGNLSENSARSVIHQVLKALHYLHERNIAHRDLKPENILLCKPFVDDIEVKLTDFGLARVTQMGRMSTMCGTPQYIAPEVIAGIRKGGKVSYDFKVDMWAVGVLAYILLSGQYPFSEMRTDRGLYDQIRVGAYDFQPRDVWKQVSSDAMEFINGLIEVDPVARMGVEEAIMHPWISAGEDQAASGDRAAEKSLFTQHPIESSNGVISSQDANSLPEKRNVPTKRKRIDTDDLESAPGKRARVSE